MFPPKPRQCWILTDTSPHPVRRITRLLRRSGHASHLQLRAQLENNVRIARCALEAAGIRKSGDRNSLLSEPGNSLFRESETIQHADRAGLFVGIAAFLREFPVIPCKSLFLKPSGRAACYCDLRICKDTYGTSPATQLSCGVDVMWKTVPGKRSRRVPSSYSTMPWPDNTVPICGT